MFLLAESALSSVGLEVLSFLIPILSVIATIALSSLAKRVVDKLGLKRSKDIDDMLDKYIGIGVNYAEKLAKKKLDGREISGSDKLGVAVKTVLGELKQSGIKGVAEDLIVARVEALLQIEGAAKKLL